MFALKRTFVPFVLIPNVDTVTLCRAPSCAVSFPSHRF